jgi:hypothetical protein
MLTDTGLTMRTKVVVFDGCAPRSGLWEVLDCYSGTDSETEQNTCEYSARTERMRGIGNKS